MQSYQNWYSLRPIRTSIRKATQRHTLPAEPPTASYPSSIYSRLTLPWYGESCLLRQVVDALHSYLLRMDSCTPPLNISISMRDWPLTWSGSLLKHLPEDNVDTCDRIHKCSLHLPFATCHFVYEYALIYYNFLFGIFLFITNLHAHCCWVTLFLSLFHFYYQN